MKKKDAADFELEMEVRDYECDLQGIVNNAVYLSYLEHTRHCYLKTRGIDFAQLHDEGMDLVLVRVELDYRAPLRSGDCFAVDLKLTRPSALRFAFEQQVLRLPQRQLVLRGYVVGTCLVQGRPSLPSFLLEKLGLPLRPEKKV
jgi:acyl-CoA thioester hydrolase